MAGNVSVTEILVYVECLKKRFEQISETSNAIINNYSNIISTDALSSENIDSIIRDLQAKVNKIDSEISAISTEFNTQIVASSEEIAAAQKSAEEILASAL